MLPLVSVIVPVYNVEKYLEKCVDSLIHQTYQNLEIILVDDGSTDSSGEKCDNFAKSDNRVHVIHQKNGGSSSARNTGLEICNGEYISFLDSDDYFSECFIEIMIDSLLKYKVKMAVLNHANDFWDGEAEPIFSHSPNKINTELEYADKALMRMLYYDIPTGAPYKICHRDFWDTVRFPFGYTYEDLATTYKLFMQCDEIAVISDDLYAYRKRNDSNTRISFSDRKLLIINIADQLVKDVKLYNAELEKAAETRAFSAIFSVFLQVPLDQKEKRIPLWEKIKKYREAVIFDYNPLLRKKNKYAAYVSYLGTDISWYLGRKFGRKNTFR